MLNAALQAALPTTYKFEGGVYKPNPAEVPEGSPANPFADWTRPAGLTSHQPRQKELGVDPFAQYRTAQALFQLVTLLNKSITSAKKSQDCTPYLLTLQMSLIPYAQNQPYDAYTDFALFLRDQRPQSLTPPVAFREAPSEPATSPASPPISLFKEEHVPNNPTVIPEVVPLLVTDNLEATSVSNASRMVRQFSLSLAAALPQIAGKGQFDKFTDQLDRSLGEDLNSLITTARLSENIFRVRFGANRQGTVPYAMVPQTHRVFLLVLVPRARHPALLTGNQDYCQILAMTRLRHRDTGKQVPMRDKIDVAKALSRAISPLVDSGLLESKFLKVDVLLRLIAIQMTGDFRVFAAEVEAIQRSGGTNIMAKIGNSQSLSGSYWQTNALHGGAAQHLAEVIWLHISQVWSGSVYSTDVVELDFTVKKEPVFGYPKQSGTPWALLTTYGKSSVVRINGFENLDKTKDGDLDAYLKIKHKGVNDILIPAQFIQQMKPDIVSYDFGPLDEVLNDAYEMLIVINGGKYQNKVATLNAQASLLHGASLGCSTKVIVPAEDGTGLISFSINSRRAGAFVLQIGGATVKSLTSEPAGTLSETGDGRYTVNHARIKVTALLTNLDPASKVRLALTQSGAHTPADGPAGPPLEIEVREKQHPTPP